MKVREINPYIRLAMRSIMSYPFYLKRRVIMDYELIYLESGTFFLEYDGIDYLCRAGDFLLLRPGIRHEFRCIQSDISQPHIHFDMQYDSTSELVPICFKDLDELSEKDRLLIRENVFDGFPVGPIIRISDKSTFLNLFYYIVDSFKDNVGSLPLKIAMMQLLDRIEAENFPNTFEAEKPKMGICAQIKGYMKNNLYHPLTLDSIEKQFNYSKFYLTKQFEKEYGCSLIKYHQKLRLEHAKQLLETMSVSQVCEYMHFGSVYAFSRAFRNYFHYPPSAVKHMSDKKREI